MLSDTSRIWALAVLCPLVVLCTSSGATESMSTQTAMHAQVESVYSFSPTKVTADVRKSTSSQMDAFWQEVKQNRELELPLLRNELKDETNPPFFMFDGSSLLLALSQSPSDMQITASALPRTNLKDVQSRQYLYTVHGLAVNGINVTPAALHMLDDPKFEVYLPEHGAYRLDQTACLLVALLPLKTDVWLPAVIDRIQAKPDTTAMKTLLLLLFYAQTNQADRLLRSTANETETPKDIREFANVILKHERDLGTGKKPSRTTEEKLREERRTRMSAVSDEAMDDMNALTAKIVQSRTLEARAR